MLSLPARRFEQMAVAACSILCWGACSSVNPVAPELFIKPQRSALFESIEGVPGASDLTHARFGALRLNQIQVKGTHNSYHQRRSWTPFSAWELSHAPLDVQLEEQGVRALELDTRFDEASAEIRVLHVPHVDEGSSCRFLSECLRIVRVWSDAHPDHLPLFIQIEVKDDEFGAPKSYGAYAERLDEILRAEWGGRVVTPDDVQGSASTLREAVTTRGWPTLADARGKALFFLDDREGFHDAYTRGGTSVRGRMMFPESRPTEPFAAFVIDNEPSARIRRLVSDGFIVRTRADVYPAGRETSSRRAAALDSGAQILSTDYPVALGTIEGFLPGNSATLRCNPITAASACSSFDSDLLARADR